jgi:signal transduction histidine kinase
MLINEIIALSTAIDRLALSDTEKTPLYELLHRIEAQVAAVPSISDLPGSLENPYRLLIDLQDTPTDDNQRYSDATKILQLRAVQLRTAAEISGRIAEIRDPQALLSFVAETLSKRFGFYHVSILLIDDSGQVLMISAVNSDAFKSLVTDQVSIRIDQPCMISWAATHRQPCVAPDVRVNPFYVAYPDMANTRSEIALPLIAGDRLLGVIDLESELVEDFDEGDIQTLQSLANKVGTALDNAYLFEAEQNQRRMADTLRDINLVISTLDQDEVLDLILEQIGRVIHYDAGAIWLLDESGDHLRLAASAGYERFGVVETLKNLVISEAAKALTNDLVLRHKIIIIPDVQCDSRWTEIERFEWVRSWAGVRISVRGKAIGLLLLDHSQVGFYGPRHAAILDALAIQISIAVENAQLFEAERRQREIADTLRDISTVITRSLDRHTVLQRILEQVGRVVPYDAAGIWLHDAAGHYRIAMGVGYEQFGLDYKTWPLLVSTATDGMANRIQGTRQVVILADTARDSQWKVYPGYEWIKSWAAAPILGQSGVVIGILSLDSTHTGFYTSTFEPILASLADQISIAVNNARLFTALQESERRAKAMLDAIPDLMFRYNAGGDLLALSLGADDGWQLTPDDTIGKPIKTVLPEVLVPMLLDHVSAILDDGKMHVDEYHVLVDGELRDYEVRRVIAGPGEILSILRNVTERKRAEAGLKRTLLDLKRSNDELQQFAYVASHDLQEPLRMVASYVQLLARRYQGKLDSDADEFIAYAVDGAVRMQRLINDLLAYSRVNTKTKPFESTSCEQVLQEALDNLQIAIEDNHAEISHDPLPFVMADPVQLIGVFQNLIGNAIKFHGKTAPRVHISAQRSPSYPDQWLFAITDNGIGIAPAYAERIFVIFKRLHTAAEYPGNGIGLSICKKVIELHGGRIWVESAEGQGATFYFTLPANLLQELSP